MKKTKKLLLSLFALLTTMTAAADNNDWHFATNPDGTATVICFEHDTRVWINGMETWGTTTQNCYSGDAEIPSVTPDGKTVTGIGNECFRDCVSLTSLIIPNTVKNVGEAAIYGCHKLKELVIPESVETMGRCAVWSCDSIERVVIGESPNTLEITSGYEMFRTLPRLQYIYQGRNVVSLDASWPYVFRSMSNSVETIEQGPMVTQMQRSEFESNAGLKTFKMSPNVTVIPENAFLYCESLADVEWSGAITSIGMGAFNSCGALKTIPDLSHCKEILQFAFAHCKAIESVVISASVDTLGYGAFYDNEALTELIVEDCDQPLKVGSSGMFSNDAPNLKKAYFGRNAESTNYLPYGIIERNPSVEEITFAGSCSYLRGSEFANCKSLKTVRLGKNMNTINAYAFGWAYEHLEQMTLLICEAEEPPVCKDGAFAAIDKETCTLQVPAGSLEAYKEANGWKEFFNILPIDDDEPGLDKDEEGNYLIASADDWRAFANLTIIEPSANAKMTADIDLGDDQTTVGTQDVPYAGTFDGNGHTLTVAYSQNITGLAPFRYINGATIQKIHITGTIDTQTGKCAAGIVSYSTGGTTTISECWSSAKLKGDDTMGGICAVIQDGTMNINDCLVDGTISGSNAYNGGFISHPDNTATVNINNGLFLRYADADVYWSGTFFRSDQDWFGPRNLYNCYYFYPYGYPQGIQATEEELTDGTLAVALQDGREEQIWGQNTDLNHPVPVVFLSHVAHSTEYETSCDYFDWHGQRYTTSGTYTYEEKNAQGEVTDIYTLELTIHYSTTSSLSIDFYVGDHYATDMYDFTVEKDGETTYYYTTTNAAGCDSVIVLGITILEPQTYETNATINEGESYEWRGNTYTEAGTYTDEVLTEYGGVKEIYILNLTVTEGPATLTQKQLFATRLADMHTPRMSHQIMPVDDGIVVFGGHTTGFSMTKTAERYNISTDKWMQMDMLYYQDYSAGIVTSDGKMLLAGGMSGGSGTGASDQCEFYDPTTNSFTSASSLEQARSMATATMTESGKIYVNGCWYNDSEGLECYDPETGYFWKVADGMYAYHPLLLAMRGERIVIVDSDQSVVVENGTTTPVESELLREYVILKGWDDTQMTYYQVADYSHILVGRLGTQVALLNVYDDAAEGIKITKVADLPMTLPDDESVKIGYYNEGTRVFASKAAHKLYVQTCLADDGCSPIIVEYDYPSAQRLEGGNFVVYATDKPLKHRTENAAWTMLADGTLVSVGGGNSNFDPHTAAYIYYLGDGSEDPDGIKEIESLTPALSKGDGAVYDLSGRRIPNGQLPRGIYIVSGKKVLVK